MTAPASCPKCGATNLPGASPYIETIQSGTLIWHACNCCGHKWAVSR